jgi:hypothetical protein
MRPGAPLLTNEDIVEDFNRRHKDTQPGELIAIWNSAACGEDLMNIDLLDQVGDMLWNNECLVSSTEFDFNHCSSSSTSSSN